MLSEADLKEFKPQLKIFIKFGQWLFFDILGCNIVSFAIPANKASPPDLAIRRRKCDGGGYIVPL